MPPSRIESSLEGTCLVKRACLSHAFCWSIPADALWWPAELVDIVPDLTDDLLNTIDQPLQAAKDAQGNTYLNCDYNRDGDSYRSGCPFGAS